MKLTFFLIGWSIAFFLLVCSIASAQTNGCVATPGRPDPQCITVSKTTPVQFSRFELFAGYSYLHFTDPGYHVEPDLIGSLDGGSVSGAFNLTSHLGLVGDFGIYEASQAGQLSGGKILTFLFGPRLSLRARRFTPFIQALGGGARFIDNGEYGYNIGSPSWGAGGGLDVNLSKHFGVRAFQLEYLKTYFSDGIRGHQENVRASAGVMVRF